MKTWARVMIPLTVLSWAVAAWAAPATAVGTSAAIRAVEQAPDPSAVVAAYANGTASDPNDPNLYSAYVRRMTELGLPELAYHQAQTLTTLQSTNGFAWGVVAYVDARRGAMADAIFAINLAGQFAPQEQFVQRTAGEILAWYDLKADRTVLPEKAQEGLAQLRALMQQRPAFVAAYDTAKQAYQTQTSAVAPPQPPLEAVPQLPGTPEELPAPSYGLSGDQVPPVYSPEFYPYAYDWGPGWVEPTPWWWWQPVGAFDGLAFYPYSSVILFDRDDFFHRHHQFRRDHADRFVDRQDPGAWHRAGEAHSPFFGSPARPSPDLQRSALARAERPAARQSIVSERGDLGGEGKGFTEYIQPGGSRELRLLVTPRFYRGFRPA